MKKNNNITLRVSDDTLKKLEKLAELSNRTRSNWIETKIAEEYLKLGIDNALAK